MDLNGALWRTSTRSSANGDNCVEVAALPLHDHVPDSPSTAEVGHF
ncbi:MAG: hypothetical protein JWR24_2285 [Actinoallomurus sp.]|jgi:hypothetical protein|nr:hypothetical protein [Actinoallomurus sp.]